MAARDSRWNSREVVFLSESDLARFRTRLAIIAIDGVVALFVAVPPVILGDRFSIPGIELPLMYVIWWVYFAVLKRTRFGTLGTKIGSAPA